MKRPPDPQWRPWLYTMAWLGGGMAATLLAIWIITLIRYNWPGGTEALQLGILGNALYLVLSIPILVMVGLGLRNAIRSIKGTAGVGSFEVSGHDSNEEPGATVTTTTETKVTP